MRAHITHPLVQEVHVVIFRTDRPSRVLKVVLVLFYHKISLSPQQGDGISPLINIYLIKVDKVSLSSFGTFYKYANSSMDIIVCAIMYKYVDMSIMMMSILGFFFQCCKIIIRLLGNSFTCITNLQSM